MNEFCGAEYSYTACGGNGGFWGGGSFGGDVARRNDQYGGLPPNVVQGLQTHNERLGNALAGNGYLTNSELSFQIIYWYDDEGNIHTTFTISVDVGGSGMLPAAFGGALDSWTPDWPRAADGYSQKWGWKTQPPPKMEEFPERIRLGPGGVESGPEFDPTVIPSNASRISQLLRGTANAAGKIAGPVFGALSIAGTALIDVGGVMMGPAFIYDPCRANPYDYRCRPRGPGL